MPVADVRISSSEDDVEERISGSVNFSSSDLEKADDKTKHPGQTIGLRFNGLDIPQGAIITNVFVGEGVRMGRQYSAENCLFFANCEGFHGEAVALSVTSFRGRQATRRGPAHLYRYLLALDAGKTATTLTLPDDRRMVVVAITAEMAEE